MSRSTVLNTPTGAPHDVPVTSIEDGRWYYVYIRLLTLTEDPRDRRELSGELVRVEAYQQPPEELEPGDLPYDVQVARVANGHTLNEARITKERRTELSDTIWVWADVALWGAVLTLTEQPFDSQQFPDYAPAR